MEANVTRTENGTYVSGGPLTTSITREGAPDLLLNEIDRRVTLIRPSATPIDQISRLAGSRSAGSMTVDYYAVDTKAGSSQVFSFARVADVGDTPVYELKTRDLIFDESETILVPGVTVSSEDSDELSALVLYVMQRDSSTGVLRVIVVNEGVTLTAQQLPKGTSLVRMGRAAAELDVQTAQFEALPVKRSNNCQIFKMQIEESTYQKLANKEADWGFSDQEEVAVMDMRLGMEKTFLFGRRARFFDPLKREEVTFTGGIWYQAGKDFSFEAEEGVITPERLVDLMREAFTGASGSSRKILVGGSGLIAALNKMQYDKVVSAGDTYTRWGIDFDELHSKFGSLLVKHSEVFDSCGYEDSGLVIDPEYLTKYVHVPFTAETLDLRSSGVRNVNAVVVTEASCMVLRHPNAHVRVHLS